VSRDNGGEHARGKDGGGRGRGLGIGGWRGKMKKKKGGEWLGNWRVKWFQGVRGDISRGTERFNGG